MIFFILLFIGDELAYQRTGWLGDLDELKRLNAL